MSMPLRQSLRLGAYLAKQKIKRVEKFPLLVELEPLFACNLKCAGCGKIEQPHDVLKKRMPVEQAVAAVLESGAPMVSIAGGEPLMHKQIDEIVRQLLDRNKIVFLCTNAVLLPKHIDKFAPHRNFAWMVHIDGMRDRHDESVRKIGVFDQAVAAIEECGAPMVSIAGGEPLMHPQIDVLVAELIKRKKYVFLCTNALLLPKHLHKFTPHRNFAWMVHIDGLAERHDESVRKVGGFDAAIAALKQAKEAGFRVLTNTTFFNTDTPHDVIGVLDYLNDVVKVDNMQISPAYAYGKAPDQ